MSKKAKLPGMPEQGIPLKTIHKGLKNKPKSVKAVKQPKPQFIIDNVEVSEKYYSYYIGPLGYSTIKSASPVISSTKPVDNSYEYNIRRGGVKTDSFEEGMKHLYEFPTTVVRGFNYALLMKEHHDCPVDPEGCGEYNLSCQGECSKVTYNMVDRVSMPCWGALREYNCGTRPDDIWPGDLREPVHIFPATGNPIAVAIQFHYDGQPKANKEKFYSTTEEWNRFQSEFVFNTAISPWRKALKDFEFVIKDDEFVGVVIKDTNIDPNIMVNIFRVCGFRESQFARKWCNMMDANPGMDGRVAFILACKPDDYYQSAMIDLDRWFSGNPFDLSSGLTFYKRESYNRPRIQYMFGDNINGIATNTISKSTLEECFSNWLAEEQDATTRVA